MMVKKEHGRLIVSLKTMPSFYVPLAIIVGILLGVLGTLIYYTAQAGILPDEQTVQRYGPHPDPPSYPGDPTDPAQRAAVLAKRTALVPVGPPACEGGRWFDARTKDSLVGTVQSYGTCSPYPSDMQLRILDYSFVGPGFYLARYYRPRCADPEFFQPHKHSFCIAYDPPESIIPISDN